MIKNVIFDLGRVIYNFEPRADLISLGFDDKRADKLMECVFGNPIWLECDRGTYTIPQMIDTICKEYPDMAEDVMRVQGNDWKAWTDRVITIMPDSLEFFYEVKRRGFKVYILTNFPEPNFSYVRERDAFYNDADGIVVSAHEKINKPDHGIYINLLERYKLVAEETLFIDDMPGNIAAAKELGFKGIQFINLADCKRQFEEILTGDKRCD